MVYMIGHLVQCIWQVSGKHWRKASNAFLRLKIENEKLKIIVQNRFAALFERNSKMKLPFEIDLTGKVCVVTGAGGVLCSMFAEALAKTGAKVALLDLNEGAAKDYADKINKDGGIAKGYACNVLDKNVTSTEIFYDFFVCFFYAFLI